MPGAEVTIADVTNQGQCGIGRLGEVCAHIVIVSD